MDPDGTTTWHVDMASPVYAASLGTVVAQLHATDVAEAAATGIEVRSAQQARQAWRDDLEHVAAEFRISPSLRARWDAWLAEDSYWPQHTVLTHGELYPATPWSTAGRSPRSSIGPPP